MFLWDNKNLTFDLHYPEDKRAEAFKTWVNRISNVASVLSMSYAELWNLPEQEFLVLEDLATQAVLKAQERQKEILHKGE